MATPVVPPPNTGAVPIIPVGSTGPESALLRYDHDVAEFTFNTFKNMDRSLRQKILDAAEDNFFRVLHRTHQGYSGSSMLDLLTHLYKTYVAIMNT